MKCNRLGCLNKGTGGGRCDKHKTKEDSPKRKVRDHHALYGTSQWQRMRQQVLARNPLCCRCQSYGYTEAAIDVDHIVAHDGDTSLFYDMRNLQGLCKRCHSWKTQRERQAAWGNEVLSWL